MFFSWTETLKEQLSNPLPGAEAWKTMAPIQRALKLPEPDTLQKANLGAVMILLYPNDNSPHLVLMKRQEYPGVHSGQISFPGGKIEPGETPENAALRETAEETGVSANEIELIGKLTPLFIPPSNFLVHPYIGRMEKRPEFNPDPVEVAALIEVSAEHFLDPGIRKKGMIPTGGNFKIEAPYFDVHGHVVWGATAIMLSEFAAILTR